MKPKALFICGPAGSGKSTLTNQVLDHFSIQFPSVINVDQAYETILMNRIGNLNINSYNKQERSIAAGAMQDSLKVAQAQLENVIEHNQNVILDGTGGSTKKIFTKRNLLLNAGYDTYMVMNWADIEECFKRNHNRDGRKLVPSVVLENWVNVINAFNDYYVVFGSENFDIHRGSHPSFTVYNKNLIKSTYFDTIESKVERTPEQLLEKEKKMNALHKEAYLLQNRYAFIGRETNQIIKNIEQWLLK